MAQINNGNSVGTVQIGGVVLPYSGLLIFNLSGKGSTNQTTSVRTSAGVAYLPSGSKAFRVRAIRMTGSEANSCSLGYAATDQGSYSGSGTIGNNYGGDSHTAQLSHPAAGQTDHVVDFLVPNAKYLTLSVNGGTADASVTVYGYEE